MQDDATVAAGDIARMVGVGRPAVSNWRRRFHDFPEPVGGTSSNPLFSLAEVESWLRGQGKLKELPEEERVWQQIRNSADDLQLASLVGNIAAAIAGADLCASAPASLIETAAALAAKRGTQDTVELLYQRYVETHSRRVQVVPEEVAMLMANLLGECETVLDPLCGFGALLLAANQTRGVMGQERDEASACLAAARLVARGITANIRVGDALLADAFPDVEVDGVLCIPPFNERGWGYEELTNDTRWQYGLPPKGESELAWVQHCLARVKPGGQVVVLMPPAAANRRSGRRIRSQLLRTGTLQAVIGLPAGSAPQSALPPHVWVLRRPQESDSVPSHVTMAEGSLESGHPVPIIDLLDDEVDLTPSRRLPKGSAIQKKDPDTVRAELEEMSEGLTTLVPKVVRRRRDLTMTTVGELIRAGAAQVEQTPMRMETESGTVPLLTAKDITLGRGPSGRSEAKAESVVAKPGNIVIPAITRSVVARVVAEEVLLGPHLYLVRLDQGLLDPDFVAGFLRVSAARAANTLSGSYRVDVRRSQVPRLPISEQRRYGEVFRQLESFERAVRAMAETGDALAAQIFEALMDGEMQPETESNTRSFQ